MHFNLTGEMDRIRALRRSMRVELKDPLSGSRNAKAQIDKDRSVIKPEKPGVNDSISENGIIRTENQMTEKRHN